MSQIAAYSALNRPFRIGALATKTIRPDESYTVEDFGMLARGAAFRLQPLTSMPLVSIIVPAWNVAEFIPAAIRSVFAQSFTDFELIVVNDGSPDTAALEAALGPYRDRPNIHYLVHENLGPSGARNTGIRCARGTFVAFLDADDWWEPTYLEQQLARLSDSARADVVYCDALLTGESPLAGRTYMDTTPSNGPVTLEALITLSCNVPTTCTVARRAAVVSAGLFDPHIRRCEDFDLWLRMSAQGSRFAYHRAVLAFHRLHATSAAADGVRMFESQRVVYRKLEALLGASHPAAPLVGEQIRRAEADLALERSKQLLMAGEYPQAAEALDAARRFYRSPKLTLASIGLRTAPALVRRMYGGSAVR
jgi:GT2 family glycosyltransferase